MPDDAAAERFSSFPRFEGHLEAGGSGGSGGGREKRDATPMGEGDQGECGRMIPFLVGGRRSLTMLQVEEGRDGVGSRDGRAALGLADWPGQPLV